ncbi:hypothetical protein DSO57_1013668 [Entomophthora muscae]|uniref:Uncharacterized protein n=1 Tax=Entomophthora muscae TaxID=34485 RepID=A0ACC2U4T4_9FUNG|nr:hypothetical protein DSO57_1013668 [Entomophthora muscae]
MSKDMSQEHHYHSGHSFAQVSDYNTSAQANYLFASNVPNEQNPFETSFQGGQNFHQNQQGANGNNFQTQNQNQQSTGDGQKKMSSFTRSSTQEVSDSGREKTNEDDDEDPETKRQRFLERNRIAASKCRQKKKVWMQQLATEADQAAARNKALQMMVNQLKDEVLVLKNQLLAHRNCSCNVIQQYIQTSGQFATMNVRPPSMSGMAPSSQSQLMLPLSSDVVDPSSNLPPQQG